MLNFVRRNASFLNLLLLVVVVASAKAPPAETADFFQLDRFVSELLYAKISYSSERTLFVEDAPMNTASIAYDNGNERQETFDEDLGMSVLGITRSDEGIVYLKTTSSEMPALDQETRTSFEDLPGATDITKTEVGSETINGVLTTKFEIAAALDNGAAVAGHMWLQGDGIPVKIDLQASLDDLTLPYHIEQTDIELVEHADELFAIPAE